MSAPKKVQLFYDTVSPYSWVGFELLCRYKQRWNISLELCPFALYDVYKATGNKAPNTVQAKKPYIFTDLMRIKKYYQLPLHFPHKTAENLSKIGTVTPQKFLLAAESECPGKLEELTRELFLNVWSRDEDVIEVRSLRKVGEKVGISGDILDKMEAMIETEEMKKRLEQRVQEAVGLGSFGAPYIVVHMENGKMEGFFGSDRMELMASVIDEKYEGPLNELKNF